MKKTHRIFVCWVSLLVIVGCQPTASIDLSFGELVNQLTTQYDTIREGMEGGGGESVHHALHEVMATLQKLVLLRSDSGLSAEQRSQVKSAAEKMSQLYQQLDAANHGGEEVAYDEVAEELQQSLATISGFKN